MSFTSVCLWGSEHFNLLWLVLCWSTTTCLIASDVIISTTLTPDRKAGEKKNPASKNVERAGCPIPKCHTPKADSFPYLMNSEYPGSANPNFFWQILFTISWLHATSHVLWKEKAALLRTWQIFHIHCGNKICILLHLTCTRKKKKKKRGSQVSPIKICHGKGTLLKFSLAFLLRHQKKISLMYHAVLKYAPEQNILKTDIQFFTQKQQ